MEKGENKEGSSNILQAKTADPPPACSFLRAHRKALLSEGTNNFPQEPADRAALLFRTATFV